MRRLCCAALAFAAMVFASAPSIAQSWPERPVRIVVPYAAGGITDIVARALAQRLTDALGQQVVIENRPGGNSQIGAEQVARAAPDGYTLLVSADTTFVTNAHLESKQDFDPLRDFVPISGLGISPQALVVHPTVPAKTFGELLALAKQKPGALNYGTFGIGSSGHLNIELLQGLTGTQFTPVHYRGAAPAITDLVGGHIQMMVVSIGLVAPHFTSDRLRVLGFGSEKRIEQFPEVPTLAESLPGFEAGSWYGFVAPKGTPPAVVARLSAETQKIFADPAFREKILAPSYIFSIAGPPEGFASRMNGDFEKWGKVIRAAGVKAQ